MKIVENNKKRSENYEIYMKTDENDAFHKIITAFRRKYDVISRKIMDNERKMRISQRKR